MSKGLLNKTSSSAVASHKGITKDKDHNKGLITVLEVHNKTEKLVHRNSNRIIGRHNKTEKADRRKTEIKIQTDHHGHRVTDHRSQTEVHKARKRKENNDTKFKSFGLHRNFFYATSFVLLKGIIISI